MCHFVTVCHIFFLPELVVLFDKFCGFKAFCVSYSNRQKHSRLLFTRVVWFGLLEMQAWWARWDWQHISIFVRGRSALEDQFALNWKVYARRRGIFLVFELRFFQLPYWVRRPIRATFSWLRLPTISEPTKTNSKYTKTKYMGGITETQRTSSKVRWKLYPFP
jgi:hypothetical protein